MTLAKPPQTPFDVPVPGLPIRRSATVLPIPAGDGVVICTIARSIGDDALQAHIRTLQSAIARLGVHCQTIDPFVAGSKWRRPMFVVQKAIAPFNSSAAVRWHRRWHSAALRENLIRRLQEKRPRVIIAQCPPSAQAAMEACAALGIQTPIALVVHFNHSEANEFRAQGRLASRRAFASMLEFEKGVLAEVDQVIYISAGAKRAIEIDRGIVPRSSAVIWNGIDDDPSSLPAGQKKGIGSAAALSGDEKVLLNIGAFEPGKNHVGLLEVFANIAGREPGARLLLAGDGPLRRQIKQKIEALRLGDRVRLLGRPSDVSAILPLADLYVHFAAMENCPVALLEAARAAIPAVAAAGGGAGEILAALEQSKPLPPNPTAAANAILNLLGDESRRKFLAASARRNFQQKFTAAAMAENYLATLRVKRPG